MPSRAVAIKYITLNHAGTASGPLAASSFINNAPLLADGSVGDTSTGYTQSFGGGSTTYNTILTLIDLGPSPPAVTQFELEVNASNAAMFPASVDTHVSNDGVTWTLLQSNTVGSTGPQSVNYSFSATTRRYWQFVSYAAGTTSSNTFSVTDVRLYDASSVLIGAPSTSVQILTATRAVKSRRSPRRSRGVVIRAIDFIHFPPAPVLSCSGSAGYITLQWNSVAFGTTYHIKRSDTEFGTYATIATVADAGPTNTYIDSGLANGTTYWYKVSGVFRSYEGADSNTAHARTYQIGLRSLLAYKQGYVPALVPVALVENQTVRVNVCLPALTDGSAALFGRVMDVVTNAPISGATVACGMQQTASLQDGAYLITGIPVPPETEAVDASAVGYYPLDMPAVPFASSSLVSLDLGLVSLSTPVGSMTGFVFDAFEPSRRLPDAIVSLGRYLQAVSALDGSYLIPYVPSETVYRALATLEGYLPKTFNGVIVSEGQRLNLDFPMIGYHHWASSGSLVVTVVEAGSNKKLAGARVSIGSRAVQPQTTDTNGVATFPSVIPGNYTAAATLDGYRVGTGMVTVSDGQVSTMTITLAGFPDWYVGGQVYGWATGVLIPPGQPVPGCVVYADPAFAGYASVTDTGGFYLLDQVPAATYAMNFDDIDYVPATVSGVKVLSHVATECDVVLVPWDGRLPAGWRLLMFEAQPLSRRAGWVVATLDDTPDQLEALRPVTLPLASTYDVLDLGRYRRVRWQHRSTLVDPQALLRFAVGIAPLTTIPAVSWMAIAKERPAPVNAPVNAGDGGAVK